MECEKEHISEYCKTEHLDLRTQLNFLRQQFRELTLLQNAYKALTSSIGNNEKKVLALQTVVERQSDVTGSLTHEISKCNEENKIAVTGLEHKIDKILKETTEMKRKLLELERKIDTTSGSRGH
uniref:Uncharacterized protein n=1 Tax=Ciona savignyi TaxID=51511 RepID=H2ZH83_CIOSA